MTWLLGLRRRAHDWLFERYDRRAGFDARYGTDTTAVLHVDQRADRDPEQLASAHQYCPVHARALAHLLEVVSERAAGRAFVDLGSGKGRAVLAATSLPFAELVGVELGAELHRIAVDNLRRARPHLRDPARVRLVHGDARAFAWPAVGLVVFAFCPFTEGVMASVIEALDASLDASPRPCTFVYAGSAGPDAAIERSRHLRVTRRGRARGVSRLLTDAGRFVVFDTGPA